MLRSLQFLNLRQSVGHHWLEISPLQGCYLHRTTQAQNKRRQTSMPSVQFKSMIPVFEQVKTLHALARPATVFSTVRAGVWNSRIRNGLGWLCSFPQAFPFTHSRNMWNLRFGSMYSLSAIIFTLGHKIHLTCAPTSEIDYLKWFIKYSYIVKELEHKIC
jgi:hypothetical protein